MRPFVEWKVQFFSAWLLGTENGVEVETGVGDVDGDTAWEKDGDGDGEGESDEDEEISTDVDTDADADVDANVGAGWEGTVMDHSNGAGEYGGSCLKQFQSIG